MQTEAVQWLKDELVRRGVPAHVYEDAVHQKGTRFHIPVHLKKGDAYNNARLLVKIENAWESIHPRPETQLFLLPAPPVNQ